MLLIGTQDGLLVLDSNGGEIERTLEGSSVGNIALGPNGNGHVVVASDNGVLERQGTGEPWETLLGGTDARCVSFGGDGTLYAGINPAAIYRRRPEAKDLEIISDIENLPSYWSWTFPVTPHLPNLRALTPSFTDPATMYAGVEVGGVIATRDSGGSWAEFRVGLQPDIHSLESAPGTEDKLYASTGVGFFKSTDAGRNWHAACDGLHAVYTVPLAVHPAQADTLVMGVNTGRPRNWRTRAEGAAGVMYRTTDGAGSWSPIMHGLSEPLAPAVYGLVIDPVDDTVYMGTDDGSLYAGRQMGDRWDLVKSGLPPIFTLVVS